MKRYIVDKKAVEILRVSTVDAHEGMSKEKVLTDEHLVFSNLPFASMLLTQEQVDLLKQNNIGVEEEVVNQGGALGSDYEKVRSSYYKVGKRALTGRGCKVAILDSGCVTSVVPCDFTANYVDANPFTDVYGHGTMTSSIIKHPTMGLAPNCEFHHLKIMNDSGVIATESGVLAAISYCITNSIDIVNLSWTFDTSALRSSIASLISNGTVVCASSGNNSTVSEVLLPAGYAGVIAVNSIQENGDPFYFNVLPNSGITSGAHGISVACNGAGCEVYNKDGIHTTGQGTSFAAPFFAGVFAIYKEKMGIADNYRVLDHILKTALKTQYPNYFGAGTPTF